MARRAFKIQKGAGGLAGAARRSIDQGAGKNNDRVQEFLERRPVQGTAIIRVIPRNITPDLGELLDGETLLSSETSMFSEPQIVGPIPASSSQRDSSRMIAEGQLVGPISGSTSGFNGSMFFGKGTVI